MLPTGISNLENDQSLIKGCVENNRIAQNQLYTIYAAQMMGVCLRYARTREDAQDILQEGFIQVFKYIDRYKFKGPLEAWIKKIFINCALQKLREKENNYSFITIDSATEIYKTSYSIAEEIDLKILIRCIQNLPLISRLVFNLYVFEGLKHREIARTLKISEGTSKSNLFDARNNLKKQLQNLDHFSLKTAANE
jgi:RNA polymerase sigma factor (sigma-70 family)